MITSDTKSIEKPQTSNTMRNNMKSNVESGSVGVTVTTKAGQHAGHKDRKLDDINPETYQLRRGEGKEDDNEASASAPKDQAESRGLPVKAGKVAKDVSNDRNGPLKTDETVKTKADGAMSATSGRKSKGNSRANTGDTGLAATDTKAKEASQSQDNRGAKPSAKEPKVRPQRQAKQTALGKLKAKQGQTESDVDDMSDDSQDDDLIFAPQSKPAKVATNRNEKAKHLPTPVTAGSLPKKKAEAKSNGKLKPVKQQQTKPAASAKTQLSKKSNQGSAGPSEQDGRPSNSTTQKDRAKQSTEARTMQSSPDHPRLGTATTSRKGQRKSENTPSPRRPGALKRLGRSHPRGRQPQIDTPYDFPGTSSNTRKKRRSISRASKVSIARAGPARQRMQLESVKVRPESTSEDLQLPLVSRQVSPEIAEPGGRLQKPSVSRRNMDDARPPPETQGRSNTKQRESHVLPVVRSSYAADVESQNPATGSKQTETREKPGSSQAHAIMIEQDSRSESSCSPSPHKPVNTRSKTTVQATSRQIHSKRPQTPAMMPSSPPDPDGDLTYAKDKPTIIAFGPQGPRNQGVSSVKKHRGSAASSKVLPEYRSAKAGTPGDHAKTIGLATQLFPPSSQLSRRPSTQEKHTAEPGNVAKGDESAFGDFTKNGKNKALAHMLRQPSKVANEPGQEDQDDGFAVIDDFEGTTLIDDHEQPEYSPKQPTASQTAMPPPNVVTRGKKDAKTVSASVRLPIKTVDEAVVTKDTPRPASVKKATNTSKVKKATNNASDEQTSTLSVKDGPNKKIAKAMPTDKAAKLKPLMGQTMVQQSQRQTRKRGLADSEPDSPAKKVRMSQENMLAVPEARLSHVHKAPGSTSVQVKISTDRPDRRKSRPSRRSTQASQGVDILGSPYPKDLEVPKQTTALEVFSQQAGLSSDQIERSDAAPTGRLNLQGISGMPTIKAGLAPNNGLSVPAAPRGRSKAVTRIASGPLAEQLLAVKSVQSSEGNPFTSSRERESSDGQGPATNKFREALRKRGIDLSYRPPAVRSEELGDECFDDAERTLVEPVDDFEQAKQPVASSPGVSEVSRVESPDAAAKVLEDVGDWRNSLKPHQSHLFDSLVIAAHKLVRHMVDHETADSTIVADYRRRGEIIVDELQRAHAKEYQQYTQNVHGWKSQAADELAAQGRKLKQSMRDAEKARTERKKRLIARNGFDGVLEELVAGLD